MMIAHVFECELRTPRGLEQVNIILDNTVHTGLNAESLEDILATLKAIKGDQIELISIEQKAPAIITIASAKRLREKLAGGPGGRIYRTK
jgi:hypothetical protein